MAREGRGVLVALFRNFLDSLKPRQLRGKKMGSDYLGNEYYEIARSDTSRRPSRWYTPPGGEENFDQPLPAEWEAWLRFRRKQPPTEEEIKENLEIMRIKKIKAAELHEKFGTGEKQAEVPTSISFPKYKDFEQYPEKK